MPLVGNEGASSTGDCGTSRIGFKSHDQSDVGHDFRPQRDLQAARQDEPTELNVNNAMGREIGVKIVANPLARGWRSEGDDMAVQFATLRYNDSVEGINWLREICLDWLTDPSDSEGFFE